MYHQSGSKAPTNLPQTSKCRICPTDNGRPLIALVPTHCRILHDLPQGQWEAEVSACCLCPAAASASPGLLGPGPRHQGCLGGRCRAAVLALLSAAVPSPLHAPKLLFTIGKGSPEMAAAPSCSQLDTITCLCQASTFWRSNHVARACIWRCVLVSANGNAYSQCPADTTTLKHPEALEWTESSQRQSDVAGSLQHAARNMKMAAATFKRGSTDPA